MQALQAAAQMINNKKGEPKLQEIKSDVERAREKAARIREQGI